jgi:hypothetical protein
LGVIWELQLNSFPKAGQAEKRAKKYECKTSYIQSAEQLSSICLIERAGPGEAGETLSIEARGSDESPGPLFFPSKIER